MSTFLQALVVFALGALFGAKWERERVRHRADRTIKSYRETVKHICPNCGGHCRVAASDFRVCTRCPFFEWY